MATRIRLFAAFGALVTAVILGHAGRTVDGTRAGSFPTALDLRTVADGDHHHQEAGDRTVDPDPFDACRDIPLDVIQRIGLAFTPPEPEDSLRCHYDAGNYQMAVEAFVWRTYEESLPPDAVELDIDGHRAARFWVMKPTDWNNQWWITCAIAFKTDWGLIQQSLFYSPI